MTGGLLGAGYRVATRGAAERQGIVHRLDANTTGVMVVAKCESAYSALKQAFRDRTVSKTYHALIQGHPDPLRGTIDAPIGRHPSGDGRFAVVADGRPSVTHYDTLEAFRAASLVTVGLETGRTRRSGSNDRARHPCCGDLLYGADPMLAAHLGLTRQWLHAVRLAFEHPSTGREVIFESAYPRPPARPRRPGGGKLSQRGWFVPRCAAWRSLRTLTPSTGRGAARGRRRRRRADRWHPHLPRLAGPRPRQAPGLRARLGGWVRHRAAVAQLIEDDERTVLARGPDDAELIAAYRNGHAALVAALRAADPDLDCATFMPAPSPLAFWARRQAHGTAIHRYDAQSAARRPRRHPADAFDPAFADDGIDELIMGFAATAALPAAR